MVKRRKRRSGSHKHRVVVARSSNRRRSTRRNPSRRRSISKSQVKAFMKRNHMGRSRRRASNPFAKSISLSRPSDIVTAGAGVLVGVFVNKTLVGFLPASVTSNPLYTSLAALVAAAAEWWAFSLIDPEFGAAVGLGAIAEAGSLALATYLPSVGAPLSLSGRRGAGDFVSGHFPFGYPGSGTTVLDIATGMPKSMAMSPSAYPRAYGTSQG